jgi:hypothetical protein
MDTGRCSRFFELLGMALEAVANLCDIREGLNKVAGKALPRIPRFGRPAILLDVNHVIRPRLKRTLETRPPFSARHGERAH